MAYIIATVILCAFILWNMTLWGYRPRHDEVLQPQPDRVFDQRCRPIVREHEGRCGRAVLMIHGFPSTPYSYSYAAQRVFEAGYDVHVPLLPGFGTDPKDLEETCFTQWFAYVANEYERLRSRYRYLAVVGTSMGGSMTLALGERYCHTAKAPDALVTIAAPVFINSLPDGVVHDWKLYAARTVALFTPSIGTAVFTGKEIENDGDELWIGYRGCFVRAGLSFVHALRRIRRELGRIDCPLLAMHDRNDRTVPYKNLSVISAQVSSKAAITLTTRMQGDHNRHVLLMYRSIQQSLLDTILTFLASPPDALQGRHMR